MGKVIGELLPVAAGVAISPIPIIAVILMLLSRGHAARNSTGFLTGWVVGIIVVTVVAMLLVGLAPNRSGGKPSTVSSVLKVGFGLLLVVLAAREWRKRPKPGETAVMPKWMSALDSFTFGKALSLGLVLLLDPTVNLPLCLTAGTTIGAAHLSVGGEVVALAVFTLIGASTVAVPVIGYFVARDWMVPRLKSLRGWLEQNSATVMAVLFLVIGVVALGHGIGELSS